MLQVHVLKAYNFIGQCLFLLCGTFFLFYLGYISCNQSDDARGGRLMHDMSGMECHA